MTLKMLNSCCIFCKKEKFPSSDCFSSAQNNLNRSKASQKMLQKVFYTQKALGDEFLKRKKNILPLCGSSLWQ